MDTILYLYVDTKEEAYGYRMTGFPVEDYRLVRVGVSPELWQVLLEMNAGETGATDRDLSGVVRRRKKENRGKGREGLFRRYCGKQNPERHRQEYCRRFLAEILQGGDRCFPVCETSLPLLEPRCFRGYFEEEWVRHMMRWAVLPHFVILGRIPFLWWLLEPCMRRLKSLQWILPIRQFNETEQQLVEEIYEVYGLIVEVKLLETEAAYRRNGPASRAPAVVLDFTEEERIPVTGLFPGSIWLDMGASEEKRYRVEEGSKGVSYFSIKKEWKEPQKVQEQLDTLCKNGYNT